MANKIKKKVGLSITDYFHIGTTNEIETDESLNSAQKFINETGIVNALSQIKNNIFGEKINKNAIDVIGGSEEKIEKSGFKGERKEVGTKIAVNLIENASLEDNKDLQVLWSNMLANAVTGKNDVNISYIEILKQLNAKEVIFLELMLNAVELVEKDEGCFDIKNRGFGKLNIIKSLLVSDKQFEIIIDNLIRLNLVHTGNGDKKEMEDKTYNSIHMKRGMILLTHLGYEFIKACRFG